MSTWFRCSQSNQIDQVFSGEGGLYVPGRWNHKGTKAIYCSQSIALCTLEWLSHNGLSVSLFSYYKFSINIPDELVIQYSISDLPSNWAEVPSPNINRDFAEKYFFNDNKYLAMAIPSVMVPEELNLVINPSHPGFLAAKATAIALGLFTAPHR